jgi:hypothetical protein
MRMARVLVVVDNLYILGSTGFPPKADPPLIVEANTVLPDAIASKLLEAVPRWHPEIVQRFGRVHGDQFAQHRPMTAATILPRCRTRQLQRSLGRGRLELKARAMRHIKLR